MRFVRVERGQAQFDRSDQEHESEIRNRARYRELNVLGKSRNTISNKLTKHLLTTLMDKI